MKEPNTTYSLPSLAGIRRDGTTTDSDYYNDAQWCRWVRTDKPRPRKMGGYQVSTQYLLGPPRGVLVWSHQYVQRVFTFSQFGVQYVDIDSNGLGGAVNDITPIGFVASSTVLWSFDVMFDAQAGSNGSVLLATPMSTLVNMDDPTAAPLYITVINTGTVARLSAVTDANANAPGGMFCTPPYSVLLGLDGNVTWSDANLPQNYGGAGSNPGGDQGTARVDGYKIVKGLPMRSGSGPGALLWSLNSVIRMDFIGGTSIFQFSKVSSGESSVLSQNGFIQYNGSWYWAGIDRFFVSNGSQVTELVNNQNKDWFYDNINFSQRQKVWATTVTRWGEIWWFFPFGEVQECTHAVIYNTLLNTWYDTILGRSSGLTSRVFRHPLMTDTQPNDQMQLTLTVAAGTLAINDILRGTTTGATGSIQQLTGTPPNLIATVSLTNAPNMFQTAELFTDITSSATGTINIASNLYALYSHEKGFNAVSSSQETAIPSWFETCNFGLPTGGTQLQSEQGVDMNTNLWRVEPDFVMTGPMTLDVVTRAYAQSPDVVAQTETFDSTTERIDMRVQGREMRLKFTSNVEGGFFEAGDIIIITEPGDTRS